MGLKHAVITSVNRDELADGGASVFAATICEIRDQVPGCAVEVLTPDFKGDRDAIRTDCNRTATGLLWGGTQRTDQSVQTAENRLNKRNFRTH
jgi:lipoate synthase